MSGQVSRQKNIWKDCAFCGGRPLTREHTFPVWAHDILPITRSKVRTDHHVTRLAKGPQLLPGMLARPGSIYSQTLRVVCRVCNNGWMSQLQNAAKPFLKPLMSGERIHIAADEQEILAAWATMSFMVWECADPATQVSTFDERRQFSETKEPPSYWRVFVARLSEFTPNKGYWLTAFSGGSPTPSRPNNLVCTVPMGKLLIQAVGTPIDLAHGGIVYPGNLPIAQIFPRKQDNVSLLLGLGPRDVDRIAGYIRSKITGHDLGAWGD